jgi:hypothetical protein
MAGSGLRNVSVKEIPLSHRLADFGAYWRLITTLGARPVLEKLADGEKDRVRAGLKSVLRPQLQDRRELTLSVASLFVLAEV